MKYEYPAGVAPEEVYIVERFEDEILPFVQKHGPELGEAAMAGDLNAHAVILAFHRFINGMPQFRQANFEMCVSALKRWESHRLH